MPVKARLASFNRAELLALVQSLYAASRDNQAFLHTRLDLGSDPIAPYKETISRWVQPDVYKGQDYSITKAKKAISDYRKAVGRLEGMAELTVFYCERAAGFSCEVGMDDETYLGALVRMFEQAVIAISALPSAQQGPLWGRLEVVRDRCRAIGYGVTDNIAELFAEHRGDD